MKDNENQKKTILIIFSKNSCKKYGYLDKKQKETIMTYRQVSETDEEQASIYLSAPNR